MQEHELKQLLRELDNSKSETSFDWSSLCTSMLPWIGSTDSDLRELIYSTYSQIILNEWISPTECKNILEVCLDEQHLMFQLGSSEDDSVFMRSFSSLVIALILEVNAEKNFLEDEIITKVKEKLTLYTPQEQDVRGYVEEKGWAHSIAHVADAWDAWIKSPQLTESDFKEVGTILCKVAMTPLAVYQYEEDERLITPMIEMLKRGLPETELKLWLQQMLQQLDQCKGSLPLPLWMHMNINLKLFLRSLYFRFMHLKKFPVLQSDLKEILALKY
ncbi:DUF2785 domain-containing protein [Hazenella coriacea]|uniref:Uncharacterized protein DUF2785 n=1 Tax=Hazenella coriacea TaxID=1179467 RepID=A0A4R3L8R6_9BACL|nr:DUF2785 domain-containing protein [Hazenella coriacea]TCS95578.1 uncharacterized protein DUF2785 [Hazenella coriacea]